MNILTYSNAILEKNLKENLSSYTLNIINAFKNPYNIDCYKQLNEDFDKFSTSFTKDSYVRILSYLDDDFMSSNYRKQNYKSKGFIIKNILTKFGLIEFKRRRYIDNEEKLLCF